MATLHCHPLMPLWPFFGHSLGARLTLNLDMSGSNIGIRILRKPFSKLLVPTSVMPLGWTPGFTLICRQPWIRVSWVLSYQLDQTLFKAFCMRSTNIKQLSGDRDLQSLHFRITFYHFKFRQGAYKIDHRDLMQSPYKFRSLPCTRRTTCTEGSRHVRSGLMHYRNPIVTQLLILILRKR